MLVRCEDYGQSAVLIVQLMSWEKRKPRRDFESRARLESLADQLFVSSLLAATQPNIENTLLRNWEGDIRGRPIRFLSFVWASVRFR